VAQVAAHVGRAGDWADVAPGGKAPNVHFGAIAAGEIVQNSLISTEARWIRQHYNDALAIEMEGAGVAQAGHLSGAPVAIIRGISDRADGTKATDGDAAWQPEAAANAAAFAARLAVELTRQREEHIAMDLAPAGITLGPEGGRIIRIGPAALRGGDAEVANTIAHELSHARYYLRNKTFDGEVHGHDKSMADGTPFGSGNALQNWIEGGR
jgi:hypothetical protein